MATHYLRVDAVNLAGFVFDTHDISAIRGGSFVLLDAIQSLPDAVPALSPISTAASEGLFSFEPGPLDPATVRRDVLTYLNQRTGGHATFVVATTPEEPGPFGAVLERLEAEVHRQQLRRPTVAVPEYAPAAGECYLDGWRPGVEPFRVDPNAAGAHISRATEFRRREGIPLRHRLFAAVLGDPDLHEVVCTPDLETLSADPNMGVLSGRIALLYVDGNSFGTIRRALCDTRKLRAGFDQAIQDVGRRPFLRRIVEQARADPAFLARVGGQDALRMEVLLWGGDEFMLIVPAWRGWQALRCLYEETRSLAFQGIPLTHRAAIVFCHHNAPILQIRALAQQLLQRAKGDLQGALRTALAAGSAVPPTRQTPEEVVSRLSDHDWGDGVHYLNLESFDMLQGSLDAFTARYYHGFPYEELLLYARELDDIRDSLGVIRRNVARGAVIAAVQALRGATGVRNARLEAIAERACSLLAEPERSQTRVAIDQLTAERPWRWYLANDLWDYIPEWRP